MHAHPMGEVLIRCPLLSCFIALSYIDPKRVRLGSHLTKVLLLFLCPLERSGSPHTHFYFFNLFPASHTLLQTRRRFFSIGKPKIPVAIFSAFPIAKSRPPSGILSFSSAPATLHDPFFSTSVLSPFVFRD